MFIFVLFICVLLYFVYRNGRREKHYPPGPPFWPLVGNLISVIINIRTLKYHHAVWQKWRRQYGDVLGLKLGHLNVVVVSGKELIKEVSLRDEFTGRPGSLYYLLRSFGKNIGLVFGYGKSWNTTRKVVLKYLKNFGFGTQYMELIINEEVEYLKQYLTNNNKKPIVVTKLFGVSITNILWRVIAGRRYDLKDEKLRKLIGLMKSSFEMADMSGGLLSFFPAIRYIFPNLSGYNKIVDIYKKFYDFISETIKEHQQSLDVTKPRDVIDTMLIEVAEQREKITEENMKVICLDFLEAGGETVNNTLTFLILYILKNKHVQACIHEEINHVLGNRAPKLSDRNFMKYTEATICETLRLSSVAPMGIAHMALESATLGDYVIPKGTVVLLALYDLHNGSYWNNPSSFIPERFLNKNGELIQDTNCFMPFGTGKRRCIGESLARAELFLYTTNLLQNFEILLPDGDPIPNSEPDEGIALSPKPFRVIFKPRNI